MNQAEKCFRLSEIQRSLAALPDELRRVSKAVWILFLQCSLVLVASVIIPAAPSALVTTLHLTAGER